jgi:hypothetical protein
LNWTEEEDINFHVSFLFLLEVWLVCDFLIDSDVSLKSNSASSKILSICSAAHAETVYFGLSTYSLYSPRSPFSVSFLGDGAVLSWAFNATNAASVTLVGNNNEPIHGLAHVTSSNGNVEGAFDSNRIVSVNRKGLVNVFAVN